MSREIRPDEHNTHHIDSSEAASSDSIAYLVGQVYEVAPAPARRRLIEHLLRPLSLLALLAVANGVFAKLWFRRGWQDLEIRIEDTHLITNSDITALVDFVQQASADTVYGIGQVVASCPELLTSAAAGVLIAALGRLAASRFGSNPPLSQA